MRALQLKSFIHRYATFVLIFLSLIQVALSSCRSESTKESENPLESRVKEFWEKRVAGVDMKAYEYEEYSKTGSMSVEQYIRSRNPALQYRAFSIKEIEKNDDGALVKLDVAYHLSFPARGQLDLEQEVKEQWIRLDGQWYRKAQEKDKKPPA